VHAPAFKPCRGLYATLPEFCMKACSDPSFPPPFNQQINSTTLNILHALVTEAMLSRRRGLLQGGALYSCYKVCFPCSSPSGPGEVTISLRLTSCQLITFWWCSFLRILISWMTVIGN